jgi:hypothetical protein
VLISDGHPTDDFEAGLKSMMEVPWAKRAVRIAIAIGNDQTPTLCGDLSGIPRFSRFKRTMPKRW